MKAQLYFIWNSFIGLTISLYIFIVLPQPCIYVYIVTILCLCQYFMFIEGLKVDWLLMSQLGNPL